MLVIDRRSALGILIRSLAKAAHQMMVDRVTPYRQGDTVAIGRQWGMHVAAGIPALVERVDLDHTHGGNCGAHPERCYVAERIELHLVWGGRPDGSADFRCREAQKRVTRAKAAA